MSVFGVNKQTPVVVNAVSGTSGSTGPTGRIGQTGAPGPTGQTGSTGRIGQTGAPGQTGPKGDSVNLTAPVANISTYSALAETQSEVSASVTHYQLNINFTNQNYGTILIQDSQASTITNALDKYNFTNILPNTTFTLLIYNSSNFTIQLNKQTGNNLFFNYTSMSIPSNNYGVLSITHISNATTITYLGTCA